MNKILSVTITALVLTCIFSACKQRVKDEGAQPIDIAVKGKEIYTDTAPSSVKVFDNEGRVCIQQTSSWYEVADAFEGKDRIPLLLKITRTDLCFADSVNKDKVYKVEAKSILDTKSIEWETQFVATDINLKDKSNTLFAIHEGDEQHEDLLMRFSLLDGKEVLRGSYSEMKVYVPNSKDKRFAGFVSRKTITSPVQKQNTENLIAIITWSSTTKKLQEVKLSLKRSAVSQLVPEYTPEMQLQPMDNAVAPIDDNKGLILMKAGEDFKSNDVKGFYVVYTFYIGEDNEQTSIRIPVENDRLAITKAQYDKDIFVLAE